MDIALKQRLVGASVLIALAIVVLPMLLGGRPEDGAQDTQKIELPPQPAELDFQTRRYPVGEIPAAPQQRPEDASSTVPAESVPEAAEEESSGATAHVELEARAFEDALQQEGSPPGEAAGGPGVEPAAAETAPVPEAAAEQSLPAPATVSGGSRYVVQVASFGSIANAKRLAETLRGQGFAVLSDTVTSEVGTLHRVRVGPFPTEAEANRVVSQLREQLSDVKPRVVDLQPDQASQVTAPSDPLVRWVVQIGSFSSADNADRLVEKLRGEGLSAYKEKVAASGSTIYRVRVGPFLERDEALRVDGLIGDRLSLDGVVMSAD